MDKSWINTSSAFKAKIIGKLLGDGSLTQQTNRKPRFQFIHAASDFEWNTYCYQELTVDLPLNPPKFKKAKDARIKSGYTLSHYTQSRTDPIITYLRQQWYREKTKQIPFDMLYQHFNMVSLAWWYMDDGHLKQSNDQPHKIILSTDSFTESENMQLIRFLLDRFNLRFTLDKQNRLVLYDRFQIYYFLHLLTPYLHPSMYRKTINRYQYKFPSNNRRTTIYLPTHIQLIEPTKELNKAMDYLKVLISNYKQGMFYETYLPVYRNLNNDTQSYQIIINEEHIEQLSFIKTNTGLTYSQACTLCFEEQRQLDQ